MEEKENKNEEISKEEEENKINNDEQRVEENIINEVENIKEENKETNGVSDTNIKKEDIMDEINTIKEENKESEKKEDIKEEEKNKINDISEEKDNKNEKGKNNLQSKSDKNEGKKEQTKDDKKSKIISEKLQNVPVYIHSAKTIEINSVPVLIFFIKGKLVQKEIIRTYADFDIYRQVLVSLWPCLSVPLLPFKENIYDGDDKTPLRYTEVKTKLLNHFLRKLCESKELLLCDATKIFLSSDKNFAIRLSYLKPKNYVELSQKYSSLFKQYIVEKKVLDEKEAYVTRFLKLLDVTLKHLNEVGFSIENEISNIRREQATLDYVSSMFIDLEKSIPNTKKQLTNINEVAKPLKSVNLLKPYIVFYIYYLKVKADIDTLLEGNESLNSYRKKYNDVMNKLRKIAVSNTKYSVLVAARENKIQTTPDDKAYPLEVEAFHLRRIIEICVNVLENQMKLFRKNFYEEYAKEVMRLRKSIIAKNLKASQTWEKIQKLGEI